MDKLALAGLLIAGLGRHIENKEIKPEVASVLDSIVSAGLDGVNLEGPIRECVRKFTGPSGLTRCAAWDWNPKFNPGQPDLIIDSKPAPGGGWYGKETPYRHPSVTEGARNEYQAVYKVVEADRLIASHVESKGFMPDVRYPDGVQDRDYSNAAGQDQIAVILNAKNLDPDLVLGCSVTSSEGSPIVYHPRRNIVLSGNSRAMSIRYASRFNPDRYQQYRTELERASSFYGLNAGKIENMKTPILVREIEIPQKEIGLFASLANKPISRELDVVGKAIEVSKVIPNGLLLQMDLDEGETLRAFLRSGRGRRFVSVLIANVVQTERARLFKDDGRLTDEGVLILENALFAKVFGENRTILEAMSDGQKRALENALPELIQILTGVQSGQISQEWNLIQALSDAILFLDRNLRDTPISDYLRQIRFLSDEPLDQDTLWGQSISLIAQHGTKPRVLRDKIAQFRTEAQFENEPSIFERKKRNPVAVLRSIVESAKGEGSALFGRGPR